MLTFIRELKKRYLTLGQDLPDTAENHDSLRDKLSALRLAEGSLLKLKLNREAPDHPLQIAILGPTQAGKSTLVNFLTGIDAAGVSALAGYTVHAQGYLSGDISSNLWAERLFTGFEPRDAEQLDPGNYRQYSLQSCRSDSLQALSPSVIWDTPDFDSVAAYGYNSGVLRTLALADILMLVVSREKYADKSVWDLIELVQPLRKPMIVCINKLDSNTDQLIFDSFAQRYSELESDNPEPPVVAIPFVRQLDSTGSQLPVKIHSEIISLLLDLAGKVDRSAHQERVYSLIERHWQPWTGPINAEHRARRQWADTIEKTLEGAESQYKRDYLNHPDNYDSFKRALGQLLILLEIPGLAQSLSKARQIITWPARKLLNLGRGFTSSKTQKDQDLTAGIESTVLSNICNNTLTSLITQVDDLTESMNNQHDWWSALNQSLIHARPDILKHFEASVTEHQSEFQQDIDAAADDLYAKLEKQPATLNSLRAARFSADAAAVGLALKTGGIGVNDLLLAPAFLSVTSLLTESALGKYIDRVKARLRVEQMEAVRSKLFEACLKSKLLELSDRVSREGPVSITEKALQEAEDALRKGRVE